MRKISRAEWMERCIFSWIAGEFGQSGKCSPEVTEALEDILRNLWHFKRPVLLSNVRLGMSLNGFFPSYPSHREELVQILLFASGANA